MGTRRAPADQNQNDQADKQETFTPTTWRARVAAWWDENASDLPARMGKLGIRTAYGALAASVWLPLIEAYAQDPGNTVTALVGLVGGVGSNLVANLVQGAYDKATAPEQAEAELAERPELRLEYQQVLNELQVVSAAQDALGEKWDDFAVQLREELGQMGGELHLESGGGAIILGEVQVKYGDFVGRDKIINIYAKPDTAPWETTYLRALADECCRLPLGIIDQEFMRTCATGAGNVPLPDIYVDLDVTTPQREEGEGARAWALRLVRGEGEGRTPLFEALATPAHRQAVLLGDPGSGKTTFVNYVAYLLATDSETEALPETLRGLLPVRLVLREVAARHVPADATRGTAEMLWQALHESVAEWLGPTADTLFQALQRRLCDEGGLLLLDGLDEVPAAQRRRETLLEAVAALTGQLSEHTRVLVTARPYAYADPAWHLPDFATLALAPFNDAQVTRFIARWYEAVRPTLGWSAETARAKGQQLETALEARPYLADLASRPLLLTLMATLHSSWGQLPEDRADLYEETIKLFLGRWQRAREVRDHQRKWVVEPGISQVLDVGDQAVRSALEALAFAVHTRQQEEPQQQAGPADISEGEVLVAFKPLLGQLAPDVLLRYLQQRAGLLVERRQGVYAFPHRSFQEYLAACHLADQPEFAVRLCKLIQADVTWWREVFLLGVGKAGKGGLSHAVAVVRELLPASPTEVAEQDNIGEVHWQSAVLAAQALIELHLQKDEQGTYRVLLARARRWLTALLETPEALAPRERATAGDLLAQLGDQRLGVGVRPLVGRQLTRKDGTECTLPDILWVEVPAGPFLMGSTDDEKDAYDDERPQHTLDLPAFWIGRYPVTHAQYQPFLAAGGYDTERYWTAEGWAWRQGELEFDLSAIEDEQTRKNWANWLAQRPAEKRDRPYWWDDSQLGLANRPVVGITWYEALAYCAWLTERLESGGEGNEIRVQMWRKDQIEAVALPRHAAVTLPSEAQWEKAARGTDGRRWPWGNQWTTGRANTEEAEIKQTSAAGAFPSGVSPYGALDIAGNVWEWTRSRWGHTSIYKPDYNYPYNPDDGRETLDGLDWRILRGGSWYNDQKLARCAFRLGYNPCYWSYDLGLRVVVSLARSRS